MLPDFVVDICTRKFLLIDNEGNEQIVECDTPEEFNNVLNFCKETAEEYISYSPVLVK